MKQNPLLLTVLLILGSCSLYKKDEKILAEHYTSNKEKITIYYVAPGATANDVIQVRKKSGNKPIASFDKYNCLIKSRLVNDASLELVLTDTGYHNYNNKVDTVIVAIK